MKIISRAEAKALGQKWYFTGHPCPAGHIARRNISNRDCQGCVNARVRRSRAADPASFREREKTRRERDPMAYSQLQKRRRERHIDKRRAYDQSRYYGDPARQTSTKRRAVQWARNNKGKRNRMIAARRWWVKRATPAWLTDEHHAQIAAIYLEASRRGESVDHIYPLRAQNSCGLHVPWNLQIMPLLDNIRKGNRVDGWSE